MIIPGWNTNTDTYKVLIDAIANYRTVICLDMPGSMRSSNGGKSDELKISWCVDDYVRFIIKFIEKLNIKELDVIGHSNGGRIIIKLMSVKNLSFKINKIILIGSAGIVHKKSLKKRIKIRTYKICKKVFQIKLIQKIFPHLLEKLKNYFGSVDYKNASPIMRETLVKLVNEDVREYLPNIKVPTLLIWGENDTETPIEDAELMHSMLADSGLIRVKGCSHYVFLEQASYVNLIVANFLTGK